ncbi:MAG: ATP-binding protein [Bacteroidota bacterium]
MNPFTQRGTIKQPEHFIGRKQEVRHILNRVSRQGSVSLLGDRRIGKSSLLYHVFQKGNELLGDPEGEKFHFVYLTTQDIRTRKLDSLIDFILQESQVAPPAKTFKNEPLVTFTEYLLHYAKQRHLVLLIDEFENLTKSPDIFNDDFFENLRFLCGNGALTLITASKKTLRLLTDQGDLTSPFWNIFYNQQIGEFSNEEMIAFLVHHWGEGKLKATAEESQFLLRYPSRHPLILQVVSYWVLENRYSKLSEDELKAKITSEISNYIRDPKGEIQKFFRRNTTQLPEHILWTADFLATIVNKLSPLQGIIKPTAS